MTRNRVRAVAWMLLFLAATAGAAALQGQRGALQRAMPTQLGKGPYGAFGH